MSSKFYFRIQRTGGIGLAGLLTLLLAGLLWFAQSSHRVEHLYSRLLYPHITAVLTRVFGPIPFSLTEWSGYALILAFYCSIALALLKKLAWRSLLLFWLNTGLVLTIWFYLAWGLNYFRRPLHEILQLDMKAAAEADFRRVLMRLIQEANTWYVPVTDEDVNNLDAVIERAYEALEASGILSLPHGMRAPKALLLNVWLNKTTTSGFFSPFFHEVHINTDMPAFEWPFVLAHEKAHQMGFARESEASFIAFLACIRSSDRRVRYSVALAMVRRFLARARFLFQDVAEIRKALHPPVLHDITVSRAFWQQHSGRLSKLSYKAYDVYLKSNRIREGIKNYGGVVDYVLVWSLHNL